MIEDLENEIWKDIKGYEGCYQISNLGRVKSLERTVCSETMINGCRNVPERIMSPVLSNKGYYKIHLMTEGKSLHTLLHRLIAEAFIPNPDSKPQVNHKNLVRTDNSIENLEWMTNKENMRHAWDNNPANKEAIKAATKAARQKNKKAVEQYSRELTLIKTFPSILDASEELKIQHSNISMCCTGKIKTAGGYIWKFAA